MSRAPGGGGREEKRKKEGRTRPWSIDATGGGGAIKKNRNWNVAAEGGGKERLRDEIETCAAGQSEFKLNEAERFRSNLDIRIDTKQMPSSNAFVSFNDTLPSGTKHEHQQTFDELYGEPEDFLEIEVKNPITHGSKSGSVSGNGKMYTDYEIICRTNIPSYKKKFSKTRRRFSEFDELRKQLQRDNAKVVLPPLPESGILTYSNRFSPEFIEERRVGLERFLSVIGSHPLLQTGSKSMISFIQDETWDPRRFSAVRKERD